MSSEYHSASNPPTALGGLFHRPTKMDRSGLVRPMIARRYFGASAVIAGSLAAGAAYSWFAGEDINWDWQNYHEYGAYAFIHGRFDLDVAPGGFQTFLNPLAYLPAYLLRHHVAAPFWGMILGACHGLNLALIWWLSRLVLRGAANAWMLTTAVVIAAFGPMTLSEVGTSFADILTALPVIAGIGVLLSTDRQQRVRYVLAGMLIGAAVGLKLTNMVFLIGAGASLLFTSRPLVALAWFGIGGAAGAIGTGGVWAWTLWQAFGNPVFPFYNTVFRSPEAPMAAIADLRFMPHGLWDALAYPFYWAAGNYRSSEGPFRDPRFAIVAILFVAGAIVSAVERVRIFTRRDKQFLTFFAAAYLMWLVTFSIHRYAVGLELLTAPLIVLLLSRLLRVLPRSPSDAGRAWGNVAMFGAAVAIALWSQPADWLRRPWSDPYLPARPDALPEAATYLMIEKPLGYVVPLLGPDSRAYQLSDILLPIAPGGSLDRRIRAGLARPAPGGVWALHVSGSAPRQCLLVPYGLQIDVSRACITIPGPGGVGVGAEACPLRRSPPIASRLESCPPLA